MGDLLKYELNPNYTRESATLLAGTNYPLGAVLGVVSASGKYTLSPATGTDGSEVAAAVLLEAVDASAADVTGLVLVVRDFAQREIGHEVLIAMAIALFLTYVTSGGALALASGAAFLISELVDWAMFTFSKYKLSTRVLLSSAIAAPIDTTAFLYGASFIRDAQFTVPNVVMSVGGKMFGAVIIWWLIRQRMER